MTPVFQEAGPVACVLAIKALLEEVETQGFHHFDFKNPILFLAFTLAGLYLLLVGPSGKSLLQPAFSGTSLAGKVPLFLRHRQLII